MTVAERFGIIMTAASLVAAGCASSPRAKPAPSTTASAAAYGSPAWLPPTDAASFREFFPEPAAVSAPATKPATTAKTSPARETMTQPTPKQMQRALKRAGYYTGSIDGKLGPKTKDAIVKFQKANGLTPDGIVGRKTWKRLSQHLPSE